ncbi:hypothetical protein J2S47_000370 [Streptomyces griseoviridis]|jgi:hypothetical protein|uniref:Uncharacterized protein n=1 Tax=Streptomyces griseoviridis TaxID=45398 RepID=A0ABT9L859_STRGD|nr:hypothetical protein [Streptomyces griseoviridis]
MMSRPFARAALLTAAGTLILLAPLVVLAPAPW